VPDALTVAASFFLAPLGIQLADVGQQLGGELAARLGNKADGLIWLRSRAPGLR
jgi:hypothetical protein